METKSQQPSKITMPLAVVIAGALIAGAVIISNGKGTPAPATNTAAAQQQATTATVAKLSIRPISESDHIQGNPLSPIEMFVFTDFECPYCKQFHATMKSIMANFGSAGKIVWINRDFPLVQLHSNAPKEAQASECVAALGGNTAYWKFIDKIFEVTPSNNGLDLTQMPTFAQNAGVSVSDFNACVTSNKYSDVVDTDTREAESTGGRGTPFTIFAVKNPINQSQIDNINALANTFGPDTFVISDDKKMVSMSGALPTGIVANLINILLGSS